MINRKEKYEFLNMLSGLAILCILGIHSHGCYMVEISKIYNGVHYWAEYPLIDSLIDFFVRFGVAVFVFIGGFKYSLSYNIKNISDYKNFLIKRVKRIYRPFFYITVIFIICKYSVLFLFQDKPILFKIILTDFFTSLTITPVFYQLWFIPMYILIVLVYPIVHIGIKNQILRMIFFVILAGVASVENTDMLNLFRESIFYLLIYEIGTIYNNYYEKVMDVKVQLVISAIFMGLFIVWRGIYDNTWDLYLSDFLRVIGPVFYYYIVVRVDRSHIIGRSLGWLGEYSWPIFLFHDPYILRCFNKLSMFFHINDPVLHILFTIPLTIIVTVIFYNMIKKTILKKFII